MLKSTRCSINWGKSLAVSMLVLVLALMVISFGALNYDVTPSGIGVDWGSRSVPACPPNVKDCKTAVDWGSIMAPCNPTDPKCGAGPVAVDWGNIYSVPRKTVEPEQVAVDWGSIMSPPCKPADPKCKIDSVTSVDWGS